jgi:hypothetical protein
LKKAYLGVGEDYIEHAKLKGFLIESSFDLTFIFQKVMNKKFSGAFNLVFEFAGIMKSFPQQQKAVSREIVERIFEFRFSLK